VLRNTFTSDKHSIMDEVRLLIELSPSHDIEHDMARLIQELVPVYTDEANLRLEHVSAAVQQLVSTDRSARTFQRQVEHAVSHADGVVVYELQFWPRYVTLVFTDGSTPALHENFPQYKKNYAKQLLDRVPNIAIVEYEDSLWVYDTAYRGDNQ
jgi:hypothetical protein